MSADRWVICPRCDARNPDYPDDPDYQGTMRLDELGTPHQRFHCWACGYSGTGGPRAL